MVCPRFADVDLPVVTLYGDAHLEQYSVANLGRGLIDFGDSSSGQAMLDLVRFGASIRLAARVRGREGEADPLWARFWDGYQLAHRDPRTEAPEPALVRRLQAAFSRDRSNTRISASCSPRTASYDHGRRPRLRPPRTVAAFRG